MTVPARSRSAQFLARNRLQAVAIVEIAAHDPLDLRHVALGDPAQSSEQIENPVIGKPVIDELAVAPCAHHARAPHVLKMLRGVGDREAGLLREDLDAALALGELLQQFETMSMPESFRDGGELREQRLFRTLG